MGLSRNPKMGMSYIGSYLMPISIAVTKNRSSILISTKTDINMRDSGATLLFEQSTWCVFMWKTACLRSRKRKRVNKPYGGERSRVNIVENICGRWTVRKVPELLKRRAGNRSVAVTARLLLIWNHKRNPKFYRIWIRC